MLVAIILLLLNNYSTKEIVVETFDGEAYVVGSGSDCRAAWENHGTIPEGWRSISCE